VFSLPVVALIAAITLGLYALLPHPEWPRSPKWEWGLRGGCGLLFLVLTILLNGKIEGWPVSRFDGWLFWLAFWLLAMTNVLAAAWTILSGDVRQSLQAFGVSVLSFLGLLCLLGAWLIAGSLLLLILFAVAIYFRFLKQAVCRWLEIEPPLLSTEPFMACVAGGLLMLGLLSAGRADVAAGVFTQTQKTVQQELQPASSEIQWADQGLNFALLFGTVFISSVIGFLLMTQNSTDAENSIEVSDSKKVGT